LGTFGEAIAFDGALLLLGRVSAGLRRAFHPSRPRWSLNHPGSVSTTSPPWQEGYPARLAIRPRIPSPLALLIEIMILVVLVLLSLIPLLLVLLLLIVILITITIDTTRV